jgi:glycosyltransferase involved in cell wall biosynthesis
MEKYRLCYITRNYRGVESSGNKAKTDNEDTLAAMGARNLGLKRTFHNSKIATFFLDLAGIVRFVFAVRRGDVILLQYPVKKYFAFICNIAHLRGARTIALIHDLGSFRRKKLTVEKEIARLSHADCVIGSNRVMEKWLKDNGLKRSTGALGLFDYLSDSVPEHPSATGATGGKETRSLVYAGALNMRKNSFILQLPNEIKTYDLHIYGNRDGLPALTDTEHIIFHPFTPADEFIRSAQGDFGFVWDGGSLDSCTGNFGEYLRYNSPHKVSFYLRAGLPVIIWSDAAVADIIEDEGIGIRIHSIGELNALLPSITDEQMSEMRRRVKAVGDKLKNGYFFRTAVSKALEEI